MTDNKETVGVAAVLAGMGFVVIIFNIFLRKDQPTEALNNILLAFDCVGWGLILFAIGFLGWKFKCRLFPTVNKPIEMENADVNK